MSCRLEGCCACEVGTVRALASLVTDGCAAWHSLFVYRLYGRLISGVYPTGLSEGLMSCVIGGWLTTDIVSPAILEGGREGPELKSCHLYF